MPVARVSGGWRTSARGSRGRPSARTYRIRRTWWWSGSAPTPRWPSWRTSPLQAEVVMLRVVAGLPVEEVAGVVGRSPGAVPGRPPPRAGSPSGSAGGTGCNGLERSSALLMDMRSLGWRGLPRWRSDGEDAAVNDVSTGPVHPAVDELLTALVAEPRSHDSTASTSHWRPTWPPSPRHRSSRQLSGGLPCTPDCSAPGPPPRPVESRSASPRPPWPSPSTSRRTTPIDTRVTGCHHLGPRADREGAGRRTGRDRPRGSRPLHGVVEPPAKR